MKEAAHAVERKRDMRCVATDAFDARRGGSCLRAFFPMPTRSETIANKETPGPRPQLGVGLISVLMMISALNPVATNLFIPSVPHIVEDLATDYATVQLALSLYLVASAFLQVLVGPAADRFGRRPVLLMGIAIFVAGSVCSAVAVSIAAVNIGRVIQGAGACAGMVLSRAVVRDLFGRERSASILGYIMLAFGLAPTLAPLAGGVLDDTWGWRACFYFQALLGAVALVTTSLFLPETIKRSPDESGSVSIWHSTGVLIRSSAFWAYSLTGAFANAVFFTFIAATPYASTNIFHISGVEYGAYFIMVAIGFMMGNFVTGRYAYHVGVRTLIVIGNACGLCGLLVMLVMLLIGVVHPLVLFGPMLVVNFGNGMVLPNSMAGAISIRPEYAGTAAGIAGAVQIGLGAVAVFGVGAIVDRMGVGLAFGATAIAFSLLALLAGIGAKSEVPVGQ